MKLEEVIIDSLVKSAEMDSILNRYDTDRKTEQTFCVTPIIFEINTVRNNSLSNISQSVFYLVLFSYIPPKERNRKENH